MRDPSTNELDALDRLVAGGLPAGGHPGGGSNTESLARIAFAVADAAGDDAGLDVARTWRRVAAGMPATPQPRGAGLWAGLAGLLAGSGRRGWGGLSLASSSLAAVFVLTVAAVLSVLLLSGGRAEAGFLETIDQLSAASVAALLDDEIDAAEAAHLRTRIDAVVAALEKHPEELETIPAARARAALHTITGVHAALEGAALAGVGGGAQTDHAAVVSAALLQLDTVAARLAAVVGDTDAPPPPGQDADAVTGADGPAEPLPPAPADDDPDHRDATDQDADPGDALRPNDSVPPDRSATLDDPDDTEVTRDGDAGAGAGSDATDPAVVPVRPSTDAAGDSLSPTEPARPSTDDADVVRPASGETTDADPDVVDPDPVRGDDGASVDEDTTRDDPDPTTDQEAEQPVRPPATDPAPEEDPDRDPDPNTTTDATGDPPTRDATEPNRESDTASPDSTSSDQTIRSDGSLNSSAAGRDAPALASPATAGAPR